MSVLRLPLTPRQRTEYGVLAGDAAHAQDRVRVYVAACLAGMLSEADAVAYGNAELSIADGCLVLTTPDAPASDAP